MSKFQLSMFDIILKFPLSTLKEYRLSYNDACLSDFIKNIIHCEHEEDEFKDIFKETSVEIIVPNILYKDMREADLNVYIDLWIGKKSFNHFIMYEQTDYNIYAMAQLGRALCMNQNLSFVKNFEEKYPLYPLPTIAPPI